MAHLTDDELLEIALELNSDPGQADRLDGHLAECGHCLAQLERVRADLSVIAGIRLGVTPRAFPDRNSTVGLRSVLRIAAIVILSFAAGVVASRLAVDSPSRIIPPDPNTGVPAPSRVAIAMSDATLVGKLITAPDSL